MTKQPPRPLSQHRLLTSILINQLATPGLGSLLARRRFSGAGQLCLALAGFGLFMLWMLRVIDREILEALDESVTQPGHSHYWMCRWGLILFGASWLWALVTSLSLWRQANRSPTATGSPAPPVIPETDPE